MYPLILSSATQILVGIVCLFAVLMFYGLTKYDRGLQMELITSGQMIQFPTVMILLVIIVALAIPKTISENTVSALLGGIAGYVLSQGVGRAVAREAERRASQQTTLDAPSRTNQGDSSKTQPATSSSTNEPNTASLPVPDTSPVAAVKEYVGQRRPLAPQLTIYPEVFDDGRLCHGDSRRFF